MKRTILTLLILGMALLFVACRAPTSPYTLTPANDAGLTYSVFSDGHFVLDSVTGAQTINVVPGADLFVSGNSLYDFDVYAVTTPIQLPLIRVASIGGSYFQNNYNGSITLLDRTYASDFTGTLRVTGTCKAYGEDYHFDSQVNVVRGKTAVFNLTSYDGNRFNNTRVSCSLDTQPVNVEGFPSIDFYASW